MRIEISTGEFDDFKKQEDLIAYNNEGELADVFISKRKDYIAFNCIGPFKAIVKDGVLISLVFPMMGTSKGYTIAAVDQLKFFATLYEKYKK